MYIKTTKTNQKQRLDNYSIANINRYTISIMRFNKISLY